MMSVKCVVIEIDRERYDELIKKEERLRLLEEAITRKDDFEYIKEIKKTFNLEKEVPKNED